MAKAKAIPKPNLVKGLKIIKITHDDKDSIAYPILVDEKNKGKVERLGALLANNKSSKYCFKNKQVHALYPFYDVCGDISSLIFHNLKMTYK